MTSMNLLKPAVPLTKISENCESFLMGVTKVLTNRVKVIRSM